MPNAKLKCCICKEYMPRQQVKKIRNKNVCSDKCADELIKQISAKALEAGRRAIKRKHKEEKAKTLAKKREFYANDLPHQKKLTQASFNKMRVLQELKWFKDRGIEPTCISCGRPLGNDQWCCGHFKTVGAFPELRYDPMNTYLQHNRNCNMGLSGDINGTKKTHGYTAGIKIRFGEDEGQKILDYLESPREHKKYNCKELIEIRKAFNEEVRRLQSIFSN